MNMTGTLPDVFTNFPDLQSVVLSDNPVCPIIFQTVTSITCVPPGKATICVMPLMNPSHVALAA